MIEEVNKVNLHIGVEVEGIARCIGIILFVSFFEKRQQIQKEKYMLIMN